MVVTFGTHMVLKRFILPEPMAVWTWVEPLFILIGAGARPRRSRGMSFANNTDPGATI